MQDAATLLPLLKIDLGITADVYDARLTAYLQYAQTEIAREGITLNASIGDTQLVIMYAAWLWRDRDSHEGMPRKLRFALNNRLFAEKAGASV